jgi:hypothetical protein
MLCLLLVGRRKKKIKREVDEGFSPRSEGQTCLARQDFHGC